MDGDPFISARALRMCPSTLSSSRTFEKYPPSLMWSKTSKSLDRQNQKRQLGECASLSNHLFNFSFVCSSLIVMLSQGSSSTSRDLVSWIRKRIDAYALKVPGC